MISSSELKYYSAKALFGITKRIELYEQIKAMMDEGLPIVDVVNDLEQIYKSENKNDFRAYILRCWGISMRENGSIVKEMKRWVPSSEIVMIRTAEETGEWSRCLDNLIFQMEKQREIKKIVVGQMVYPIFLSLFLILVLFGFGKYGVPMLSEMLPVERWPQFSVPLYKISMFISTKIHVLAAAILAIAIVIFKLQASYVGGFRQHMDRFPPFSIYKSLQSASFLISLASLLKSGIPLTEAVKIIDDNSSKWTRKKIQDINKAFRSGDSGAGALIYARDKSMFNRDIRVQIKAYRKLSQIDRAMHKIGIVAIDITSNNVKAATGLIKMIMIFFVAISIVWIYASFIQVSQMASSTI